MKKSQSSKVQSIKKENSKENAKEKKPKDKNDPKKDKKEQTQEEEYDFYTPEEIKLLDKFHEFTQKKFEDDEIYDVMLKCNNDEELIKNELKEMLKVLSKGEEFNWTEIGKSEYILYFLFYI